MRKSAILALFAVGVLVSCEQRREAGGSHGDLDMAQEESHTQLMDRPPLPSDPLKVQEAMEGIDDRTLVGRSYLYPMPPAQAEGDLYLSKLKNGDYEVSVTLSQLEPHSKGQLILSQRGCSQAERRVPSISMGAVSVDGVGRVLGQTMVFHQDEISHVGASCGEQTFAWFVSQGSPLACGQIRCQDSRRVSH